MLEAIEEVLEGLFEREWGKRPGSDASLHMVLIKRFAITTSNTGFSLSTVFEGLFKIDEGVERSLAYSMSDEIFAPIGEQDFNEDRVDDFRRKIDGGKEVGEMMVSEFVMGKDDFDSTIDGGRCILGRNRVGWWM